MTQYVDLLTIAVFGAIKDGRPEHFEADFREAFIKASDTERLNRGQRNSFRPTVRRRVKGRVTTYQASRPQLALELVAPPAPPAPLPRHSPEPISPERRAQLQALRNRMTE